MILRFLLYFENNTEFHSWLKSLMVHALHDNMIGLEYRYLYYNIVSIGVLAQSCACVAIIDIQCLQRNNSILPNHWD